MYWDKLLSDKSNYLPNMGIWFEMKEKFNIKNLKSKLIMKILKENINKLKEKLRKKEKEKNKGNKKEKRKKLKKKEKR